MPANEDYGESEIKPFLKESLDRISADEKPLLDTFTTSMMGQIVSIWYELHVFIKHDAWNEFGEGNFVAFPILIKPKPRRMTSNQIFDHSGEWNPGLFGGGAVLRQSPDSEQLND